MTSTTRISEIAITSSSIIRKSPQCHLLGGKNTKKLWMYPEKHLLSQLLTSQSGSRVALSMCPQSESAYGSNSAPDALITFCMTFRSTSKYMANPDLDHPARIAGPPFRFCACPAGDVHQTRIFLRVQNKVGIVWGKDLLSNAFHSSAG